MFSILLLIFLSLALFYEILSLPLSGLLKFILIVAEMYTVSFVLSKKYDLSTEMGFILLKSKKGIAIIDKLAKNAKLWNFFADVGTVISYGLLSVLLFKKQFSWKSLLAGLAILSVLSFLVAPFSLHFLSSVLTTSFEKKAAVSFGNDNLASLLFLIVMYAGGFFSLILLGIFYYGAHIAILLFNFLIFGQQTITTTQPGGTFLLPGINLPLLEGVLALAIVLIVHESSHAVLSRIASIPLLSSGIVLFGIIPIGAFVEPDEKKLVRLEQVKQTRILVAGSTANFITSVLFFIIFVCAALVMPLLTAGFFYDAFKFLYVVFGLTFSLNFVVATVNLLPLPLFDGYRILELNVKNKMLVKAIMYATIGAFLLNFVPWLFI